MIASDTGYSAYVQEVPKRDFRVRAQVYTDAEVFAAEMRRIFERTWVYVGHASEIPEPGNFKTAAIGRIPIILTRDDKGTIHVLVNTCRHRGSVVCHELSGTAHDFQCPYHGWTYALDGTLLGVPPGYPAGFDVEIGGLVTAGQVAVYRELIFARIADDGDSLDKYLGPVRKYVDCWLDQSPTGRMQLQAPTRASYPANWKLQLENTTDGWHAPYAHESAFGTFKELLGRDVRGQSGLARGFDRGHGLTVRPKRIAWSDEIRQAYTQRIEAVYGAERLREIFQTWHITLFPNLQLMESKIRVIQPVAVDKTIVYEYPVQYVGVRDDINAAVRRPLRSEGSLTAGFVNSDDVEIFTRVASGLQAGHLTEWVHFARGMEDEVVEPSGERSSDPTHEVPQRAIFREWARLMEA